MQFVEIYADDDGESHFREHTIPQVSRDFAPPSQPVEVSPDIPTTSTLILSAPAGWDQTFHCTPRKQYAVLLSGRLLVTCSDGDTRTLNPGHMVLLNDLEGKGHLSQVQGPEPATFLLVGLRD